MRDGDLTGQIALGVALGGSAVCVLNYLIGRLAEKRETAQLAAAEHEEWQVEIASDLAGGVELSPGERATLNEIEWAEAPAMDTRLDEVEDDMILRGEEWGGGEESSSSS